MPQKLLLSTALTLIFTVNAVSQTETTDAKKEETRLDKVTVSATFTEKKQLQTVKSVSVIGAEEIADTQSDNVFEMLSTLPGVDINGGPNRQGAKINIRGISRAEQIIVRVDGITQYFEGYRLGSFFGDPELMKQVDVVRGPVSTLYGSGAIGGVINMQTKDASDFLRSGETIGAKAKIGFNTVNDEKNASVFLYSRPVENIDLLGAFTLRDSDDFTQASGETFVGSSINVKNILLKGTVILADYHSVNLSYQYGEDSGIVEYRQASRGTRGNGFSEGLVDRALKNTNIGVKYAYEDEDNPWLDLRINFGYSETHNTETGVDSSQVSGPVARRLPPGETRILTYDSWQLNLINTSKFGSDDFSHTVTFGADYYSQNRFGEQLGRPSSFHPNGSQSVFGAFIQDEINIYDRLIVTPAVRYASYVTEGDTTGWESRIADPADFLTADMFAKAKTYTAWTPSITAELKATDWFSVIGGYYKGFRAPAIDEIYAHSFFFGRRPFPPGSSSKTTSMELQAETATTYEGGVKLNFNSVVTDGDILRAKIVYFNNKINDKVVSIRHVSALINPLSYTNDGKDEFKGVEFEGFYDNGITYARMSYSTVRGFNFTRDRDLRSTPADKFTLSIGTRFTELDLNVGLQSQFIARHHTIATDSQTDDNDSYNFHNIFLHWTPEILDGAEVRMTVNNLFNKDYRRHNSGLKSYGRDFRLSLAYQF